MEKTEETTFIVNKGGAVHSVTEAHAYELLETQPGFRPATEEEIAAWYKAQNLPVPGEEAAEEADQKPKDK